MSNTIEIEAKAMVGKSDYEKLLLKYHEYGIYSQTNHYIDSPEGILSKERLALRIRRDKSGAYEMTLKVPLSHGLLEKNCSWSQDTFLAFKEHGAFPEGDIKKMLMMLDIDVNSLRILTSLTTDRIDVPYKEGKLSIDRNIYSGMTDYEVELEHNNEQDAEKFLQEFLEENGIAYTPNKKSKVARAIEAYKSKQ